ncbi:TetR/AcrR family transcriptional regulator [Streptomyces sp. NBC_00239]|uniref:TetR/AcrR family transcriptional regulator n=1 Tax=Streptomyces sp. NBC_00239 TaxID=2903640 RepID=UPI002E2BD257|nr:TetR/AcrR family transcriptional regulator [Streptomyces sp. NBC_00239]
MTPETTADRETYHHGNLRAALVEAGVELAREGGPSAIVLREAARRVGVSPNAAYRHFASLPDLVGEVARQARGVLADAMDAESGRCGATGAGGADAVNRLHAVGEAYIRYALANPGLFATSFPAGQSGAGAGASGAGTPTAAASGAGGHEAAGVSGAPGSSRAAASAGTGAAAAPRRGPFRILEESLAAVAAAGYLAEPVESAALNAWAGVHGLSLLLLGPRADLSEEEREAAIEDGVTFVIRGLTSPGAPGSSASPRGRVCSGARS